MIGKYSYLTRQSLRSTQQLSILMAMLFLVACSRPVTPAYGSAELNIAKSIELDYLLYLPLDYSPESSWPLVLYLTGFETANDIDLIKQHGPPLALAQGLKQDFFLVAPQLPGDVHWDPEAIMQLLNALKSEYHIDLDRMYITGIGDRGGWGVWDVATSYPGTFSKIAPISAPACTEICRIGDGATRIYHGAMDTLVPIEDARNMLFELDYYCKADVELIVFDSSGHNIWDQVYADQDFWAWFTDSQMIPGFPLVDPIQRHFSDVMQRTVEDKYLLYLPRGYEQQVAWPLVVFLHGSGSAIDNIEKIREAGPPKLFETGKDSEFLLLAPQLYANVPWDADRTHALIQKIINEYHVDPKRVYITGLSRGGFGTWELAVKYPELFAAVAPIAARDIPGVERLAESNVWIFHGLKDDGLPWQGSQFMYNRLENIEANVQLTLFKDAAHNAWDPAYNSEDFWQWLLAQRAE